MKRIGFIVLAVLLVLTMFVGCNKQAEESSIKSETPTNEKPTENSTVSEESDTTSEELADSSVEQPEGYPMQDIRWIVPAPAGAALDLPSRVLANLLDLGANVVVENIGGGSQTIGTAAAVTREADGYTLLTMANACAFTQPLMNELAYQLSDFRKIVMLAPFVQGGVVVKADSEIQDIDDWLELLSSGESYSYGVTNAGGFGHMSIASTLSQLGYYGDKNGVMVVYNGSANNIAALLSGEPDFIIADATDVISHVEAGEVRVITILHNEKSALFPDAPIISDYGVENMSTFVGMKWISVRKDTPEDIVAWLKQELNKTIQTEEYQQYMNNMGFGNLREYTEEEINEIIATAVKDYGDVMKTTGIID
jgi:tripartite-type tricarboxylate transporter receptor subunit TctC